MAAFSMLLFAFMSMAQNQDSLDIYLSKEHGQQPDIVAVGKQKKVKARSNHSPTKATLWAIVPGGGQIYNRKYWKLAIVYGGIGTCVYFANWNQEQYQIYSDAFDQRENGEEDEFKDIYTDEQLVQIQNFYAQNKELSIIIGAGIYLLSIIDANVDAHLFDFDLSDDLSARIEPTNFKLNTPLRYTGIKMTIQF